MNVPTTLVLNSVTPNSVMLGSGAPVTFQATLTRDDTSAGVVGATITFTVDGSSVGTATTEGSGVATFSTYSPSALTPGSHNVQASFAGQNISGTNYLTSSSGILPLDVFVPVPTSLVLSFVSVGPGGVTYTATLTPGTADGTITLKVDGIQVGSPQPIGPGGVVTFTFNPSGLGAGPHTVQASFTDNPGGTTFLASDSGTLAIHVPTVTTISPDILFQFQTADVTITGTQFLNPTVSFGPGTQVNSVSMVDATTLIVNVTGLATAFPAEDPPTAPFSLANNLTVTNSDGGVATKPAALTVVRDSDADGVADDFEFGSAGTFDFGSVSQDAIPDEFRTGPVSDNCPVMTNQNQGDADLDGTGDICDRCPSDPNIPNGTLCPKDIQITTTILTDPIPPLGDFHVKVNVTFPPGTPPYLFIPALPGNIFFSILGLPADPSTRLIARSAGEHQPILIPDSVRQSFPTSPSTTTAVINVGDVFPDGLPPGATLHLQTWYDSHTQVEDPEQLQVFCPPSNPTCAPPPLLMGNSNTVTTQFTVATLRDANRPGHRRGRPLDLGPELASGTTGVVDIYIGNLEGAFNVNQIPVSTTVLLNGLASPRQLGNRAPRKQPDPSRRLHRGCPEAAVLQSQRHQQPPGARRPAPEQ